VKERQNYFIIGGWKEGKKERKEARKKEKSNEVRMQAGR
jgi:hypothetical protein